MKSKKTLSLFLSSLLLAGAALPALAANDSPVGLWKTVDDKTGQEKALIQLAEVNGKLQGRILHLYHPSRPNPTCDKCDGARKDKPITGMTIVWDLKGKNGEWKDGKILDPQEGKIYSSKVELADGGQKLNVRGYLGVSALGRTQTWVRQPDNAAQNLPGVAK